MFCWRKGSTEVRERLHELSMPLDRFVADVDKMVVARAPGVGVWLTKVSHGASPMLLHHVAHNQVLHKTVLLLTFTAERRPRVPFGERFGYQALGHGIYHVSVKLGFMQTPDIPLTLHNCAIMGFSPGLDHVHYYIAHERVVRRSTGSKIGAIPFGIFLFLTHIASRAPDFFRIPNEGLSEVGFRVEI
jgi:KUP system potassium uptake protein